MEMIVYNGKVMDDTAFTSIQGWETKEFKTLTNCEEIETEKGFELVGYDNDIKVVASMSTEDYFEGKHFTLN